MIVGPQCANVEDDRDFLSKELLTDGRDKKLKDYSGRVILITNVASIHDVRATSEFLAMNALQQKFGDRLAILAVRALLVLARSRSVL